MHPRALEYHPVRTDYNCLPLYNEIIALDDEVRRQPLPADLRNDPAAMANEAGTKNLIVSVRIESLLARKYAEAMDGVDPESNEARSWGESMSWLLTAVRDFKNGGENIFHIQSDLLALFRHSDIGDAEIDRIRLPYGRFYLHFGPASAIPVGAAHFLDGAYILNAARETGDTEAGLNTDGLFIHLTTRAPAMRYETRLHPIDFLMRDPQFQADLWFEEQPRVDLAITKARQDLGQSEQLRDVPSAAVWTADVIETALHLVANTLLFLSSDHAEITNRYPAEAPANLVRKATHASTSREQARADSKLWSLGFRRVKFIGDAIQKEMTEERARGESLHAHWRRGHWRQQPHGPNLAMRKAIWIKPTIVRADLGEPVPRRIYDVPS